MVRNAEVGERKTREVLSTAGITVEEIISTTPTLENTFVSILRELAGEMKTPAFPIRRDIKVSRDDIAIGARNLNKRFGDFQAVKNINLEIKYGEIYGLLGANGAGKRPQ